MKLACPCGETVVDAGDASPGKGWLIADQDLFLLRENAEPDAPSNHLDDLSALARPVLACPRCGRLTFADPVTGERLWFRPEAPPARPPLGSLGGNAYPVPLIGGWRDWLTPPAGDLFWGTSGDRPGGFESFSDWSALERRYFEMLDKLRAENRLAHARLQRGSETVHSWPGAE